MRQVEDFIQRVVDCFTTGDVDYLINHVTEDIEWKMAGEFEIKGIAAVKEAMEPMRGVQMDKHELIRIFTTEDKAVVEGKMTMPGTEGNEKTYAYCDIYELDGLDKEKIKRMTSYLIEEK